jgi:hypothetical protein
MRTGAPLAVPKGRRTSGSAKAMRGRLSGIPAHQRTQTSSPSANARRQRLIKPLIKVREQLKDNSRKTAARSIRLRPFQIDRLRGLVKCYFAPT